MSLYIPNDPARLAEASEPSPPVVKEASQRDQMLRDLEQFLSVQLTNPKVASLRKSRYGGRIGSVASE
jgi:hypothetical protein